MRSGDRGSRAARAAGADPRAGVRGGGVREAGREQGRAGAGRRRALAQRARIRRALQATGTTRLQVLLYACHLFDESLDSLTLYLH